MKTTITILALLLPFVALSQSPVCFSSPDGIDNTWTGGWSYKEYIIPAGYKIDSVYGDFDRPGYPVSEGDFIFSYCQGTTVYNNLNSSQPFNYMTINTSLYDHWIDLTPFNYASVGVVRIFLPINAGAIWNDLCLAVSSNCSPDISTGLIGSYQFTGNADDISGSNNHGIINGPVMTTDRFGNTNSALYFNGISDYVSLPSGSATSLNITGDYALSFWIKTSDPSGLLTSLGDNVTSPPNAAGYLTGINGGNVGNGKMGSATRGIWNGSVNDTLSDNAWHHIAISLKADTLSFYIDNQLNNQATGILAPMSWNGNRVIGCRNDLFMTPLANYEGVFDDLYIFNRALTSCDIDSLYNMPNPISTGIDIPANVSSTFIYPNPSTDIIHLNITSVADVMILNYSGQVVKSIHNSNGQVDISDLNSGVYLLQVKSQDSDKISLHKLVKY